MNIILFFTYGISLKDWREAGILNKELELYRKLYKDHKVNFTFVTYGSDEDLKILSSKEKIKIVPVYGSRKVLKNKYIKFLDSFLIPFRIKNHIIESDIIKTNQLYGGWVPIIANILYKKPLLVRTGYDLITFSILNNKEKIKIKFYELLTKYSLSKCEIYIVSSETDKKFLELKFNKYKSKLKVRPNWIKNNKENEFSERHNNKIISVGRLEKQKNYHELIKSLSNSNFELIIYGSGSQKSELINLAKKLGVNMKINKPIENNLLIKELNKFRLFLSASNFEGNPKAVLEAMSCGCVPIVKYNENITDIITDNKNGYIFNTEEQILPLIYKLIDSEKDWEYISNATLNSVLEKNEFSKIVEDEYIDYLNLFSKDNS